MRSATAGASASTRPRPTSPPPRARHGAVGRSMRAGRAASDGRDGFGTALLLAAGGWALCVLLQVLLYLRPAPHGGPVLLEWQRYFGLALYYDLLGIWLIAAPFLLFWIIRRKA